MADKKSPRVYRAEPLQVQLDILDSEADTRVRRKDLGPLPVYLLHDVLSPDECSRAIRKSEELGFEPAGLAIGRHEYRADSRARNNQRVVFDDRNLAEAIWKRVKDSVDERYENRHAAGLNWIFRAYRYETGDRFAPHADERMEIPGGDFTTLFSFMIYLNDDFTGGETTFFRRRKPGSSNKGGRLPIARAVRPREGAAIVFDHLLFHEGSVVRSGVKYALRSDLIYEKRRN